MFKRVLPALAAGLLFATMAAAQISGLCNTGQTRAASAGCTGVLVTPNPQGGGPQRDNNWALAYPYPSTISPENGPCDLKAFIEAWVDTPFPAWLANSTSSASEWITPFNGENNVSGGSYVYGTTNPKSHRQRRSRPLMSTARRRRPTRYRAPATAAVRNTSGPALVEKPPIRGHYLATF